MAHEAEDVVTVDVDLADVYDYPVESSVGTLYQIGINGVGYMLADNPAGEHRYLKQTLPLDPTRLATSDTPFSEAIERYSFASSDSWDAGSGQRYLHRDASTASAYYSSSGLDPFTKPGRISLLNATILEEAETYAAAKLVTVGTTLYYLSAAAELSYITTPGGSPSTVAVSGAGTIKDLATDGQRWYACDGSNVYRGTTSSASFSTQDAYEVEWAGGRICAAVASAGSTPNRFTTLNDSGAEERSGGHLTLPAGTTITLGGSTAGHVYFGAYAGNSGSVYAWPLGLDVNAALHYPFEALELPKGLVPTSVAVGGGYVWVRAHRPEGTSKGQAVILQCAVSESGALIASTAVEIVPAGGSVDHAVGGFAAHGDLALFGWKTIGTNAGVGAVSLISGGWAKYWEAGADGDVPSIDIWQGLPVWIVKGSGVWRVNTAAYATAGEFVASTADGGSGLDKIWDTITVVTDPLGAGESVTVTVSTNDGGSFTAPTGGVMSTAGTTTHTTTVGKKAKAVAVKAALAGNGTSDCAMSFLSTRYHPLGLADTLVQVPIDCGDNLTALTGAPLLDNGPGNGAARARTLQSLVQSRVKFQDVDYHYTTTSEIYEVESCDISATLIYDPTQGGQAIRMVATLTMRKIGS